MGIGEILIHGSATRFDHLRGLGKVKQIDVGKGGNIDVMHEGADLGGIA